MGGSSGGGDSQTTVRYAGYIEDQHKDFLATVKSTREALVGTSGSVALTYDQWMAEYHPEEPKYIYSLDGETGDDINDRP